MRTRSTGHVSHTWRWNRDILLSRI